MDKNEGIIMHGGSISAHNIATGQNAVASESSSGDLVALRQRIDELLSQLKSHAAELPESSEVISAAETLAHEAAKPTPSRMTMKSLLGGIAEAGKTLSSVTAAVQAIRTFLPK